MSIFKSAAAGLSLTPGQRAVLRLVDGLAVSALIAGLQAVMPLLNAAQLDPSVVPWASVLHTFIATVMAALGLSVVKFFKAQGDATLTTPPSPSAAASAGASAVPTVPAIVGAIPAAPAAAAVPGVSVAAVAAAPAVPAGGALQP